MDEVKAKSGPSWTGKLIRFAAAYLVVTFLLLLLIFIVGWWILPPDWTAAVANQLVRYGIPRSYIAHRNEYRYGDAVLGYADRHSVNPGGTFRIMLSTRDRGNVINGHLEVYRLGASSGDGRQLVYSSDPLQVSYQEALGPVSAVGCSWPPAISLAAGEEWTSGYYSIDFVTTQGERLKEVAYIVVTNPAQDGDIAIVLSTNTYQAYNVWGGHSLYSGFLGSSDKSVMVSFDRPTISQFHQWEFYYVQWLETLGYKVDYLSNFDVAQDPAWTEKYPLFIVLGHNEYWSKEGYDYLERRIFEQGKNTMFLGGNLVYWQVRYQDIAGLPGGPSLGRQIVCYKNRYDPIIDRLAEEDAKLFVTSTFRSNNRRPESMLMGVMYENYFLAPMPWHRVYGNIRIPIEGRAFGSQLQPAWQAGPREYFPAYQVVDNSLPFFQGTGLNIGDELPGLIGYEWDNRGLELDPPRGWREGVSVNKEIPQDSIKVLFSGKLVGAGDRPGLAEAVYFETDSGARVFSSGTIRWPWGLGKAEFEHQGFKTLNANLVRYMLETDATSVIQERDE
ncbi:MAG TPA: N,N-dimethylformamidase beta subunit family domain-containing protein [Acidobacteriota bacterium]|nr:N,N-dimethylformamidase beta subunit family domain-containing protein [Acidobacteriota bacterium]